MSNVKTAIIIVFAAMLALSACTAQGVQESMPPGLLVSVSEAAEYRTGPGEVYDLIGVLNPGREIEAIGVSPDGEYFLIRDPANLLVLGWLLRDFTTYTGDPIGLPISTPPPAPTSVVTPESGGDCPTPVGGGPTPVSCGPTDGSGCPTPVGGGPTPVTCGPSDGGVPAPGCPTPIGGGPTPVTCGPSDGGVPAPGCPTPYPSGPTPVTCDTK
jgi:hypothetical protein